MESVEVTILGQRYLIRGQKSKAHIRRVAEFLDSRIKAIYRQSPGTTPLKASILTALILSDELLSLKKDHESVKMRIETLESGAESILKIID
jgi:cell division protein ZapA